jgi:alkanesulfonate monooxygenase SsuD/methylene tetrahydromethanopterin reductase-like flavin-dependent oxidoreductase (luciferase family)
MSLAFHLFLPQMRMSHEAIVERAQAAQRCDFEGIAFMDHMAPPLAFEHDMWEAMTIAGWVLAHTDTLTVSHLVLCDAFRHPAVLARQVTTLDHASGGRFELGIGWGSVPDEMQVFGLGAREPRERVSRLGESLEILRALWTGETVDYAGEHYQLGGARQRPVPTRRIPITIGGVGPKTLALVRAHADWWNVPVHDLDKLAEMRPHAGAARVSVQVMVGLVSSEAEREQVTELVQRRWRGTKTSRHIVVGTAEELTAYFAGLEALGVQRCFVWFADFAQTPTLEAFRAVIAALATDASGPPTR